MTMCFLWGQKAGGGTDGRHRKPVIIFLEKEHQTNQWPLRCEGKQVETSSFSSVLPGPAVANCPLPGSCCAVRCHVPAQVRDGLSQCARP